MGLDMYLTKKVYVGQRYEHRNVQGSITITEGDKEVKIADSIENLGELVYDVGYWRKANHIHNWFVKNVQDNEDNCQEYYVSDDNLKELKQVCEIVLKNPELSKDLLPTQSGFFYGSTEYDEYYFKDLEDTIKIIDEALKEDNGTFYYSASW